MTVTTNRSLFNRNFGVGTGAVVLAAMCFGTLGPVANVVYASSIEPIAFVAWRGGIGAIGLVALLRLFGPRSVGWSDLGLLPTRERLSLLAAGIANVALNLALFTAYDVTSVAVALLAFYTYPALVALGGAILMGERLGQRALIALGIATFGMTLVVAGPTIGADGLVVRPEGLALAFLAACCEAGYLLLNRWGHPSVSTTQASAAILVISALGFVAFGVAVGRGDALLAPVSVPTLLPALFFAGLVGAALPTTLIIFGARSIGPTRTSLLALTEPVVGVALAAAFIGQQITPPQVAGGAMVLVAGVILQLAGGSAIRASTAAPRASDARGRGPSVECDA